MGASPNPVSLSIRVKDGAGKAYYTLDGTVPTEESTLYTSPVVLDGTVTVTAIVLGDGLVPREPVTKTFNFKCAPPVLDTTTSDATSIQVLELESGTVGATIYYTRDETDPTTDSATYENPFLVLEPTVFRAIAVKAGYSDSDPAEKSFEVEDTLLETDYGLSGIAVIQSSEAGDRLSAQTAPSLSQGNDAVPAGNVIIVQPDKTRQTLDGFGGSFTESAAYVLSYLEPDARAALIEAYFGDDGADYSLCRTHIASCDFSVEGNYSYAEIPDDTDLSDFSIDEDTRGFAATPVPVNGYSGLYDGLVSVDETYDLVPFIKEALAVKPDVRIIASPWTAPLWMKTPSGWNGGSLKTENYQTFADYTSKYLSAYEAEGIDIWAITPVNEPYGNGGQWESMSFPPDDEAAYIGDYLGPTLLADGFGSVKILGYDQNRDGVVAYSADLLGSAAAPYVYGTAVHWYESSNLTFNEELDATHDAHPDKTIINTEACIDSLGDDEPLYSWWQDDQWWWNENATEWGFFWASDKSLHPKYTPVHRYARNIIEGLNHWLTGWVDWNMVLDKRGGPNHSSNFCGAPVMVDPATRDVYYTPIYDVMCHFSKYLKTGDTVVGATTYAPALDPDALHATAVKKADGGLTLVILNTSGEPVGYSVMIGTQLLEHEIPANAIQTVILD